MNISNKCFCIIKFSPLSEIVCSISVAYALRRNFPGSKIIWITDEPGIQILKGHPSIDNLISWQRHIWIRDFPYPQRTFCIIWEFSCVIYRLKQERIDVVFDLEGSIVSSLLARLTCAGLRIGFNNNDSALKFKTGFINKSVPVQHKNIHLLERFIPILEGIGIKEKTQAQAIEIIVTEEEQDEADKFFRENTPCPDRPVIGIYPGADYENRRWQPEKHAALVDLLTERLNVNCLLLWFPWEPDIIKPIEKRINTVYFKSSNIGVKSILALVKRCQLIVSGDSALIQFANIANVPVLGIFGPTSPESRGPIGGDDRVIQGNISCAPCNMPYCGKPACMKVIKVGDVFNSITEMLNKIYNHLPQY